MNTHDIVVRPARRQDLAAILALYDELAEDRPESGPAALEDAEERLVEMEAQSGRRLLVALLDDRAVGTIDLLIVPNMTHRGAPWAIVENVVVGSGARRSGVGRRLVQEVVRLCREAGCYKVQLLSRRHRKDAHAFYTSLGFESMAEGFRLYLDRVGGPSTEERPGDRSPAAS